MSEINPITSTSCEKMTGTRVYHVELSKQSRDPSFEHLRIYDRNSPIKKHIPNTLVGVRGSVCVCVPRRSKIMPDMDKKDKNDRLKAIQTLKAW